MGESSEILYKASSGTKLTIIVDKNKERYYTNFMNEILKDFKVSKVTSNYSIEKEKVYIEFELENH